MSPLPSSQALSAPTSMEEVGTLAENMAPDLENTFTKSPHLDTTTATTLLISVALKEFRAGQLGIGPRKFRKERCPTEEH